MEEDNYWQRLRRKRLTRRRLLTGAALGGAALTAAAVVGCGDEEEEAAAEETPAATAPPGVPQVLRMPTWEPGLIGPADDYGPGAVFVDFTAFGGLYTWSENRETVNGDAVSYESPDGVTHIVTVRPDLVWSDGTPYNARDYELAYTAAIEEFGGGLGVPILLLTDGAKAIDDLTLQLTTPGPVPQSKLELGTAGAMPGVYPIPRHKWEKFGREYAAQPVEELVSNGPYIVESWDHNQKIVLARNAAYTGYPVNLDRIEATILVEAQGTEALAAFEAGELDIATVPVEELRRVKADDKLMSNAARTDWVYTENVVLNTLTPGLDDIRVREALYGGVDRQLIVDTILAGEGVPLWGVFDPTYEEFDPEARPFSDASVENSQRLLAAAGYPNGEGLPTYRYVTTTLNVAVAEVVQRMWKENLGVNTDIRTFDYNSYFNEVVYSPAGTDWGDMGDAFWIGYIPDYIEMDLFFRAPIWKHNYVPTDADNAQDDAAIFEADPALRKEKLQAWNLELAKKALWIPLYHPVQLMLRRPGIDGDFYWWALEFQRARYMKVLEEA